MSKIMGLIAAVAMVGAAGVASGADAPKSSAKKAVELSGTEMDAVTAGAFGSLAASSPTSIKLGSYTLTFNGVSWSRHKN